MAGRIRPYPNLRDLRLMQPKEQLQATLIALRELHNCGNPIQMDASSKIATGLLGVEELYNMMCREDLLAACKLDRDLVRHSYFAALRSGDNAWYVRWSTDRVFQFLLDGNINVDDWAKFGLENLNTVMDEFTRTNVEAQQKVDQDHWFGHADNARFMALLNLLEHCFRLAYDSLKDWRASNIGVKELLAIAYEGDLASFPEGDSLSKHYVELKTTRPNHPCFGRVATAVIARLKNWNDSLRVEVALRTMLEVLPSFDSSTFQHVPVDSWVHILNRHGMSDPATKLTAAVNWRRTRLATGNPNITMPSQSLQTAAPFGQDILEPHAPHESKWRV